MFDLKLKTFKYLAKLDLKLIFKSVNHNAS